ncbi:hypothetical protein CBM2592_A220123 [Cupriavidus taiwanensis]|nr:hypothetical protein CBM2592_A220123 [Cupriavidus taiwanensis]SOY50465.1 hypothetical protein CBM2588_A180119 [Cupriavidus taiwanensis]SOY83629.1 hypothetical protein CBM2591_A260122 [Cupriavidus taiwanensis]SOZ57636.1 hypothetical protein CBM2617_A240122 [Cupriavidus taiwanensis]SOZ79590.1 hypothetical protein CBM2618_A220121 [Cupriavidus taiwanensis]
MKLMPATGDRRGTAWELTRQEKHK